MDEMGFKKIEFEGSDTRATHLASAPMDMKTRSRRRKIKLNLKSKKTRIIAALLVFLILFAGFTGFKAMAVYGSAQRTKTQAMVAYDALKGQNILIAKEELEKTKKEVVALEEAIDGLGYLKFIPVVNGYYNDMDNMVGASENGISAALVATDSLIPYADVLGLKGDKSFVAGSAEDRIRIAVKTMGKVVPRIDDIEKEMISAQAKMEEVNPNRYPNVWKFKDVRAQIEQIKTLTDDGVVAVQEGKPLIKVLPELLGESGSKKYLVIFQNDKELRPTGGFITFYSVFRVEEGVVKVDRASDIYDLDESIGSHPAAPEIITKYLPKVNRLYIRDSNLSPDFVTSMKEFNELYSESNGPQDVDGIIAIDTHFFVNMLKILGEVSASGLTFNTENDPRCDCPQALYVLEDQTTRPVNYIRENRKGLLGELLFSMMNKALSSSPKEYWGKLFQQALKDAQQKHIVFYLYNEDAQKGIEALNWGGRIRQDVEGDYLHINDANFAGAKSNLFVQQSVRLDYDVEDDGAVKRKTTVEYRNPKPHSDCNLERGGLCLNAVLRNFQRVYVPEGTTLATSKGSEVKVETKEELKKTYFESFFTVRPLGKSQISYEYTLPFKVEKGGTLPLHIQKQSGTDSIPYEIYVNGKKATTFNLISDKSVVLEI